jgi:hypothetical protein
VGHTRFGFRRVSLNAEEFDWGSSGRRFKSSQPDTGQPVFRSYSRTSTTQGDPDEIEERWGAALAEKLKDPATAFQRASSLRDRLSTIISWDAAAEALLSGLV